MYRHLCTGRCGATDNSTRRANLDIGPGKNRLDRPHIGTVNTRNHSNGVKEDTPYEGDEMNIRPSSWINKTNAYEYLGRVCVYKQYLIKMFSLLFMFVDVVGEQIIGNKNGDRKCVAMVENSTIRLVSRRENKQKWVRVREMTSTTHI